MDAPPAPGATNRLLRVLVLLVERFSPDETAIMVVLAMVVGGSGGFAAIGYRRLGLNLRDLDLRSGYNISVLAIGRRNYLGGVQDELPDPDRRLTVRDRLVIVGEKGDLDRLLTASNR